MEGFSFQTFAIIVTVFVFLYVVLFTAWVFYQNHLIKKMAKTGVLLEVLLEKDTETNPFSIEQFWASFHGLYLPWYKRLFSAQPYLSFEIKSENDLSKRKREITFNFWVPEEYVSMVKNRLLGLYPNAQIRELKQDYIPDKTDTMRIIETAELGLKEDSAFSIKTFNDFKDTDPLASITSALTELENREIAVVQVLARPHTGKWRRRAERVLERYERNGRKPSNLPEWTNFFASFLRVVFVVFEEIIHGFFGGRPVEVKVGKAGSGVDSVNQKNMIEKATRPPFAVQVRVLVGTPFGQSEAKERIRNIVASFNELEGTTNGFRRVLILNKERTYNRLRDRYLSITNVNDVLSTVELASFAHLPNKDVKTPGLKKIQSKQQENPIDVSAENSFAVAKFRDGQQPIGLDEKARMRHIYVSGMTGVGKSTLLENMIINDIESGKGCVIVDPHGELVDVVLEKISTDREDIFVLDPADMAHPFGMNLLELTSTDPIRREMEKILVIDAYITMMKRVFGEASIGANTDDIFRMSCSAILDHPEGGGLLEMLLMLVSDAYRARVVPFIKDPIVKDYWMVTFPTLAGQGKFLIQNLNAPLNKIRRFIANGLVANIICQKKSTLNIADAINSGAVILARFSRGDMGFENSALLGSMIISKIQIAAMQRVNIPQEQRVPTYLYVDEFQNFVGDASGAKSFAEILSEARKYKLGLVIAHQFVEQLRQSGSNFLAAAIFNNCGTTISFRCGAPDGKFFQDMYYDDDTQKGFKANDLMNLGLGEVVMRIMTKSGVQSSPFTAQTYPPKEESPKANGDLIRKRSRSLICVPQEKIRQSIEDRMKLDTLSDLQN